MSDRTYIELNKNNKSTIQLNIYSQSTGSPFYPSGAYVEVRGSLKDNVVIPKQAAGLSGNKIWTTITQSVTSSASEYIVNWEIHKNGGDIDNHCTNLLVIDC
jgi:hypothetical protein